MNMELTSFNGFTSGELGHYVRELARQGLKRMFLHAWQLRLQHPLTGQPLEFRAPLPDELNRFIETLPE